MQTKKAIDKVAPSLSKIEESLNQILEAPFHVRTDMVNVMKNHLDDIRIALANHDEEVLHLDDLVTLSHNTGAKFSELFKEYKPIVTSDTLYRKIKQQSWLQNQ